MNLENATITYFNQMCKERDYMVKRIEAAERIDAPKEVVYFYKGMLMVYEELIQYFMDTFNDKGIGFAPLSRYD